MTTKHDVKTVRKKTKNKKNAQSVDRSHCAEGWSGAWADAWLQTRQGARMHDSELGRVRGCVRGCTDARIRARMRVRKWVLPCKRKTLEPGSYFVLNMPKNCHAKLREESFFLKHRPSGPMLSISRNVRLSVRLSVCLSVCSLLSYRLNVFLPPLPKVGCPIFLEIRNPWGKVMERNGLIFEHFCLKIVQNRRAKKRLFFLLILLYKTWWKPRFPMD